MQFVDTHCHIHFDEYGVDADQSFAEAKQLGVGKVICVGTNLEDSRKAIEFAASREGVWATVGAHPHDGADFIHNSKSESEIRELLGMPKVVAIGEIGLDYYHNNSPKDDQIASLKLQLAIAKDYELPIIYHVRDSWEDFWPVIDEFKAYNGVIHSFSADEKQLKNALDRGLFVALNGIMTFTKDEGQLQAAKAVPLESLLLETDAPFLTPKPFRGKVCEVKHVVDTAKFLAELRGEGLEAIASQTTNNAEKLFGI